MHHHLPPPYYHPSSHLSHSLRLALVQVGASGERVACGGQGDSDHPPAQGHVQMATGGSLATSGALDTPSSCRGGSVGVGRLHLVEDW